jgi:hypothetical protein
LQIDLQQNWRGGIKTPLSLKQTPQRIAIKKHISSLEKENTCFPPRGISPRWGTKIKAVGTFFVSGGAGALL